MPRYKVKISLDTYEDYEIEAPNESVAEHEAWNKFSQKYSNASSAYFINMTSELIDPDDDPMQYVGHH